MERIHYDGSEELESLPTTTSGTIRKSDAMDWLSGLDKPTDDDLLAAVTPKPYEHSGSTFATDVSNIRVTGDAEFISAVAGLFKMMLAWETSATRVDLKLQKVEDRDTGELTDNYALYLSAAERGVEGKISTALMGTNKENDKRILDALDE